MSQSRRVQVSLLSLDNAHTDGVRQAIHICSHTFKTEGGGTLAQTLTLTV
jgi:hypothetical protein